MLITREVDSMGEEGASAAHVVLVSFPAQGHINPLLRFGKRLASKGLLVTFTSTHDIGKRIRATTETVPIGRGFLRFEFFSDGWDVDDHEPGRHDLDALLHQLSTVASLDFKRLLLRQADEGRPVSCVVNNPFIPWAIDVAEDLRIPSAVLWVQSCAVFSTYYHYFHALAEFPHDRDSSIVLALPGLPPLEARDLPSFLLHSSPFLLHSRAFQLLKDLILSQFSNIHKARWVFANSFVELERDAIEPISERSPVIPVGPLVELDGSDVAKGDMWKAADCVEWLDAQKPRSVVYVSVGSVAVLTREEMAEMAYGLKECGRPFLWVVRDDCRELLPDGYVEEVEGRGMVVAWSPQERVLAHGAVACFATHCGWNSTLELLTAGVPVITYPQFGDQTTDAKFLVDVYGVGVRLGSPVERGELAKCVAEVTEGEKAEGIRERCLVLKTAAVAAVAEGGSSDRNIGAFVDEIGSMASSGGRSEDEQVSVQV